MNIFVNAYMVLTYFKRFYQFSTHIAVRERFFFDIAVYLQTAIMLLFKFVYTFSLFFSFFS